MPDTLEHILQDVKIEGIQQNIDKYKDKLTNFKANTKLKDVLNTHFPVPDYCIELAMEVEGWENKTVEEAEKLVVNIIRVACRKDVCLGWKGVIPGSTKLIFILVESIKISSEKIPHSLYRLWSDKH